ncbi:MAG TPA: hypothetical protein VKX31_00425 [Brumimicrobium sp.]|nr:hypothetical protein [Brumimicrobium sp.]
MKEQFNKLNPYIQAGIIAILIFIAFQVYKELKYWITKPRVNSSNIPVIGLGQSGEIVQWDPDPLAAEISQYLEGPNFNVYPEVVGGILDLQTDDQVILLYNHYNSKYMQSKTLTALIDGEWPDWGGVYKKAVARLRGLGLN